jgi:HTH-type transcriptional regulator, transcriptional repressor of NAD biosynthesis genes
MPGATGTISRTPVRNHYALTVCLHGIESVGKSSLAERLADFYGTTFVPEYGRSHCETHGTDCREDDLMLIGQAQQAMIEASRPWANRLLIADTDALMTAAWSQMMIGYTPESGRSSTASLAPRSSFHARTL